MQQAINYADILDIQFAYSSNSNGFIEHDLKKGTGTEREISLDEFPTPEELWERYKETNDITPEQEKIITEPYYFTPEDKTPRYYQIIAVNRNIEAVTKGQNRILLVMAIGTGKTYTAFQIIHRLRAAKSKKRFYFYLIEIY